MKKSIIQLLICLLLGTAAFGQSAATKLVIGKSVNALRQKDVLTLRSCRAKRHLLIITAAINKIPYKFALAWKAIVSGIHVTTFSGIDGKVSDVTTGLLNRMEVGTILF